LAGESRSIAPARAQRPGLLTYPELLYVDSLRLVADSRTQATGLVQSCRVLQCLDARVCIALLECRVRSSACPSRGRPTATVHLVEHHWYAPRSTVLDLLRALHSAADEHRLTLWMPCRSSGVPNHLWSCQCPCGYGAMCERIYHVYNEFVSGHWTFANADEGRGFMFSIPMWIGRVPKHCLTTRSMCARRSGHVTHA
jgi:hypothetical protein